MAIVRDVAELFHAGGLIMWALLATSTVLWFLMAWWWLSLRWEARAIQRVTDVVGAAFREGGRAGCLAALRQQEGCFARALAESVGAGERRASTVELDTVIAHAEARFLGASRYLDALVRSAPLLGLLGTVYGMVVTFNVLRTAGTAEPQALSHGIRCALVTTQAGLMIALPGLYGHEWLRRSTTTLGVRMHRARYSLSALME